MTIAALEKPPLRFVAGADVVAGVEQKARLLLEQVEAHRELSSSMAIDEAWGIMKKSLILIATAATAITLAACAPPAESTDSATTPAATAPEATMRVVHNR